MAIHHTLMITLEQFEAELRSWERTPYKDTMMKKGVGVDCLRFVLAMGDWLHGFNTAKMPRIPKLPPQTSLHSETLAWKVVRKLQRRYEAETIWTNEDNAETIPDLEPGNILCVKNEIHPGHVLIAGTRKNVIWHCINSHSLEFGGHVHETNLHWCLEIGLLRVWKLPHSLLAI